MGLPSPKGMLNRIKKVADGVGGVIDAPFNFAVDIAQGAFTDKELDVWKSFKGEAGDALSVFSADKGLGAAVGGIPMGARREIAEPFRKLLEDAETVYNVTSEAAAQEIARRSTGGNIGSVNVNTPRSSARAREIVQGHSPGEMAVLGLTSNVWSDKSIEEREASPWFHTATGVADAMFRLSPLDPLNAAGMGAKALRLRYVNTPVAVKGIDAAMETRRVGKFLDRVEEIRQIHGDGAAAVIRHERFADHEAGGYIADMLATADRAESELVLRGLMGDANELEKLRTTNALLSNEVDNLISANTPTWVSGVDTPEVFEQLDEIYKQQDAVQRGIEAHGTVREIPRYSRIRETQTAISRSETYQKGILTTPLRVVTNRVPHHWAELNDPQSSLVQLHRGLRRSRLTPDERNAWEVLYQQQVTAGARQKVMVDADTAMVKETLKYHGVSEADVEKIIAESRKGRDSAFGALRNRKYDAQGRGTVEYLDTNGEAVRIHLPLHITQKADLLPLTDIRAVERAAQQATGRGVGKLREFAAAHPSTDLPSDALDFFYAVWRPGTLLRLGWPQRIVLDEQLRRASEIGVFPMLLSAGKGSKELADRMASAVARSTPILKGVDADAFSREAVEVRKFARMDKPIETVAGTVESAFGPKGAPANVFADRAGSGGTFRELVDEEKSRHLAGLRKHTGKFETITGEMEAKHVGAWEWAVNQHIRQSGLARLFLGDATVDDGVRWLSGKGDAAKLEVGSRVRAADRDNLGTVISIDDDAGTASVRFVNRAKRTRATVSMTLDELAEANPLFTMTGPEYAREMGWRPHTFREHADDVMQQVHDYVPEQLRAAAAERDVAYSELATLIPEAKMRPAVHGEDLAQALGRSTLHQMINGLSDKAFRFLGELPTDALSRHPHFDHLYREEVDRLVTLLHGEAAKIGKHLEPADLRRIELQSRRHALNTTQNLLYDLAEKAELAETSRYLAPFLPATMEVGVTWTRQTYKHPAYVARMRQAWNFPERVGLVSDENGNEIDPDGDGATNPLTGEAAKAGEERYITLPFSLPGLPAKRQLSFNKKSLNLLLSGGVGFGPPVQVPVNEIVKERPELADALKFVLPFGSTQEVQTLLMPAIARRFNQRVAGEDDRVYRNTLVRIMYDRMVEFREENGRPADATERREIYAKAKDDTKSLYNIRLVAGWVLPFAPIFDSPYKPWIDTYRQAQERVRSDPDAVAGQSALLADEDGTPRSADEWFYDEFGAEFFPLAQSLSSSRDGIPPTLAGFQARERYKDLVEEYPELGGLIVGSEGAGEFNRSVYDMQLSHETRPGSGTKQRETPSIEEAADKPGVAEGWLKYGRAMDLIDAARIARGLPNLAVKGAMDLKLLKQLHTQAIAAEFPEWHREFLVNDTGAFARRLEGMRKIVADPRLAQRADLRGVADYLRYRDVILTALAQRDAKSIDAASNQDIAWLWDSVKSQLIEDNLAFADTYYRFLERDPMEADRG